MNLPKSTLAVRKIAKNHCLATQKRTLEENARPESAREHGGGEARVHRARCPTFLEHATAISVSIITVARIMLEGNSGTAEVPISARISCRESSRS